MKRVEIDGGLRETRSKVDLELASNRVKGHDRVGIAALPSLTEQREDLG